MSRVLVAGIGSAFLLTHAATVLASECRQSEQLNIAREMTRNLHYETAHAVLGNALEFSNLCLCEVKQIRALRGYVAGILGDEDAALQDLTVEISMVSAIDCGSELPASPDLPKRVRRILEKAQQRKVATALRSSPLEPRQGELAAWSIEVNDPLHLGSQLLLSYATDRDPGGNSVLLPPTTTRIAIPANRGARFSKPHVELLDVHKNRVAFAVLEPWTEAQGPHNRAPPFPDPPAPPGYVTINTAPPSVIFFMGRKLGETPVVRVNLPLGTSEITAVVDGGTARRTVPIKVASGQTLRYMFSVR